MIRAVLEMNQGHADKAVELMKSAEPYDRDASSESLYTRASALLMAGRGADAVQEFQRVLNLKNAARRIPSFLSRSSAWHEPTRPRVTKRKPARRIRISSRYGKTPTRTFRSCSKPKPSTRN